MAEVVLRIRLISGAQIDVTYVDPQAVGVEDVIDHVVATLSSETGAVRCEHGERVIVVFARAVASIEIGPRGAVL